MQPINKLHGLLAAIVIVSSIAFSQTERTQAILSQNFSNPFNPQTTFYYSITEGGYVSVKVYDVLGRVVAVLVDEWQEAGTHSATFSTSGLSSGLYFLNLRFGRLNETKRIVFLK